MAKVPRVVGETKEVGLMEVVGGVEMVMVVEGYQYPIHQAAPR